MAWKKVSAGTGVFAREVGLRVRDGAVAEEVGVVGREAELLVVVGREARLWDDVAAEQDGAERVL